MKWNWTLSGIAIIYLIVNLLFAFHSSTMTGGTSLIYVIIFPLFWIVSFTIVAVLCYRRRKRWFSKELIFSTIVLLFFCTPIPLLLLNEANQPEMTRSSSDYHSKGGATYMTETWVYGPGGKIAIKKYWKSDAEEGLDSPKTEFKKDSTWIYLDRNGDTIKTETYKNDKLIETKMY